MKDFEKLGEFEAHQRPCTSAMLGKPNLGSGEAPKENRDTWLGPWDCLVMFKGEFMVFFRDGMCFVKMGTLRNAWNWNLEKLFVRRTKLT